MFETEPSEISDEKIIQFMLIHIFLEKTLEW